MPKARNTAAETRERKKMEAEQKRIEEEQRQLAEEQEEIERLKSGKIEKEAYTVLQSEITGLYDEMDKLAKKAPNEPVTTLQLKITNSFIRKAKHLLSGDSIIDEVEIFISAGDNPEYRDVVTVLRQIRQGLERYKASSYIFTSEFRQELIGVEDDIEIEDEDLKTFFSTADNNKDDATE